MFLKNILFSLFILSLSFNSYSKENIEINKNIEKYFNLQGFKSGSFLSNILINESKLYNNYINNYLKPFNNKNTFIINNIVEYEYEYNKKTKKYKHSYDFKNKITNNILNSIIDNEILLAKNKSLENNLIQKNIKKIEKELEKIYNIQLNSFVSSSTKNAKVIFKPETFTIHSDINENKKYVLIFLQQFENDVIKKIQNKLLKKNLINYKENQEEIILHELQHGLDNLNGLKHLYLESQDFSNLNKSLSTLLSGNYSKTINCPELPYAIVLTENKKYENDTSYNYEKRSIKRTLKYYKNYKIKEMSNEEILNHQFYYFHSNGNKGNICVY